MIRKLCFVAAIVALFLKAQIAMAEGGDLWRLADKTGSIKVFINAPVNESGQGFAADDLKGALESTLLNRKSTKFEIARVPEGSDLQVATVIKSFMYMEKGPLKPTPSIGTTLLDAAATMTENYAEMSVDFVVTDTRTNLLLWKDTLNPYLKKRMTPEESIPLIAERIASHFVWKCFGKPS
ncbi:MAG: hypothetical protein Q7S07_02210 [Candidatus Omnitrophota bacterium]|nr:hypothetical protein [Candidatus Omnitrophota bacterium]